ncbi:MAG: hypothetical protein ACNA8W_25895, partial [Bradymonadaceae bacterium]
SWLIFTTMRTKYTIMKEDTPKTFNMNVASIPERKPLSWSNANGDLQVETGGASLIIDANAVIKESEPIQLKIRKVLRGTPIDYKEPTEPVDMDEWEASE